MMKRRRRSSKSPSPPPAPSYPSSDSSRVGQRIPTRPPIYQMRDISDIFGAPMAASSVQIGKDAGNTVGFGAQVAAFSVKIGSGSVGVGAPPVESSVKIGEDGGSTVGFGAPGEASWVPPIGLKEDTQTSAREEMLKREEEAGRPEFVFVSKDDIDKQKIGLIGLKDIFAKQLPNISGTDNYRLVTDRIHESVMVKISNQVVGGITYRPFVSKKFGEIVFGAIRAEEQGNGYGRRLMHHLKQHARDVGMTHFLTHAYNNTVHYFIKQGFTTEITLEKEVWEGHITHYDDGRTLMECKLDPKLPNTDSANNDLATESGN